MDIGARLRHAREARGLTLDAISRSTRVQARILSAIERNDSATLPPRPYGRGLVRAYASEVGLDPERTVRDFFSQFSFGDDTPPAARPSPPVELEGRPRPWLWPVVLVLGYAAIGTVIILAGRWTMERTAEPRIASTTAGAVPVATTGTEPAPPPRPAPTLPVTGVVVVLEAQGPSWITATVDGKRTVYRLLETGERVTLTGTRDISVRAGDAGAVRWQVNGREPVPMGRPGEVLTARATPEPEPPVKQTVHPRQGGG